MVVEHEIHLSNQDIAPQHPLVTTGHFECLVEHAALSVAVQQGKARLGFDRDRVACPLFGNRLVKDRLASFHVTIKIDEQCPVCPQPSLLVLDCIIVMSLKALEDVKHYASSFK